MEEADGRDRLPFTVELQQPEGGGRIVGRAASLGLARAILTAARNDYPAALLILRQDGELIEEGEPAPAPPSDPPAAD